MGLGQYFEWQGAIRRRVQVRNTEDREDFWGTLRKMARSHPMSWEDGASCEVALLQVKASVFEKK
jgi:hypothetical protein